MCQNMQGACIRSYQQPDACVFFGCTQAARPRRPCACTHCVHPCCTVPPPSRKPATCVCSHAAHCGPPKNAAHCGPQKCCTPWPPKMLHTVAQKNAAHCGPKMLHIVAPQNAAHCGPPKCCTPWPPKCQLPACPPMHVCTHACASRGTLHVRPRCFAHLGKEAKSIGSRKTGWASGGKVLAWAGRVYLGLAVKPQPADCPGCSGGQGRAVGSPSRAPLLGCGGHGDGAVEGWLVGTVMGRSRPSAWPLGATLCEHA